MGQLNAVLVNFSITGAWSARAKDKRVTEEVTQQHNASDDAGAWSKNLFPDSMFGKDEPNPYKEFRAAVSRAKAFHYDHTLAWEKPLALVKGDYHEQYDNAVNVELRKEVTEAAEAFFNAYEGLIERARPKLNGTFDPADYPALERLRKKFQYNVAYSPVPESGHFVDTIAGPKLQQLRDELDRSNQRKIDQAMQDVWVRMLEPIQRLAEKMTEENPQFHNSIVDNIRAMLALVPEINITNDHRIANAARTINDCLSTVVPERLRESQFARVEAAQKAVGLLQQFGQMGGRKLAVAA